MHDAVCPSAAEGRGKQVASRVGDVEAADDYDGEVVGRARESLLDGDVEDVEGAEGDARVVDCERYCGEAEVCCDFEGIKEDAADEVDVFAGF